MFNFSIEYQDSDDNAPTFINLTINSTSYAMYKENLEDLNYTDGCTYRCEINLIPSTNNYSYYFICSDGIYSNSTIIYNDLEVNATNYNPPILANPQVTPEIGINSTLFNFTVNYTDQDNNLPSYVQITINSTPPARSL